MNPYKEKAARMRQRLASIGVDLTHSNCLEAVAAVAGARSWQELCANGVAYSEGVEGGIDDLQDILNDEATLLEMYREELDGALAVQRTPGCLWAAMPAPDGSVIAVLYYDDLPYKRYVEGEVFKHDCPAEILDALTPTDDPDRVLWRKSARIIAQRNEALDNDELTPWWPYWVGGRLKSTLSNPPNLAIAANDQLTDWLITDGVGVERVTLSKADTERFEPVSSALDSLSLSDEFRATTGRAPIQQGVFGDPGFEVAMMYTVHGGVARFLSTPFDIRNVLHPAHESLKELDGGRAKRHSSVEGFMPLDSWC